MVTFLLLLESIVMGVVEGVTEFLPISSTGHLILVGNLIGFNGDPNSPFAKLFEVVIQLGAILAIVVLYRKKILSSLKTLKPGGFGFKLWTGIILALVPAGLIFVIDKKVLVDHSTKQGFIEKYMMNPWPISLALLVGGIWLLYAEWRYRKNDTISHIEKITYKQAFIIGLFQCISIVWTGFSRSASTIIGGWIVGLTTPTAAEFSFFLAIPAMLGASGGDLLSYKHALTEPQMGSLIIGFVVSFIVALIVVKKFMEYIKHKPMKGFAYYRIIVGGLLIVLALANVIVIK